MSHPTSYCLICGSKRLSPLYEGVRDHYGVATDAYRFLRCTDCDTATLHPLPTPETLPGLYPPAYTFKRAKPSEALASQVVRALEWHAFYLPIYRQRIRLFRRLTGLASGSILEVGCGSGHFLAMLAAVGYDVEGVDISEPDVAYARGCLGLRVFHGEFEDLRVPGDSYDAVVLYAVLEHVLNPSRIIERAFDILKPGGVIVIGVPVIDSWQAWLLGRRWWQVTEAPRHLMIPSCRGIHRLLTSTGFKEVRSRPAPLLDNAGVIALSLLPAAATASSYGCRWLTGRLIRRGGGALFFLPSVLAALAERFPSSKARAGAMMFCATR